MQLFVTTQAEYDQIYRSKQYVGNEVVLQNNADFINVKTDVTVGQNGRAMVDDKSTVNITVKNNGMATATGGKSNIVGYDNANIIAKGNCKIELNDEARVNCFDNCNVTLKGFSEATATDKCSVYAYDETCVLATGNTKVYSYQTSTAKGSGISTINAQDNCVVYASENCTVNAKDSCLIVAEKFASIKAADNCLVMSNHENPNVTLMDKCEHIKLNEITEQNIVPIYKQVANTQIAAVKPLVIIGEIDKNIPLDKKVKIESKLKTVGMKDQMSKQKFISNKIEAAPTVKNTTTTLSFEQQLAQAKEMGRIQGVCESMVALGKEHDMAKKLMSTTNVTIDQARKMANPKTVEALEKLGTFPSQKQEQTLSQAQGIRR